MLAGTPTVGVYALIDPRNDIVVYVGKSLNCEARFNTHRSSQMSINKNKLIRGLAKELRSEEKWIKCLILESCDYDLDLLSEIEEKWINYYRNINQCVFNVKLTPCQIPDDWYSMITSFNKSKYFIDEVSAVIGKLGKAQCSDKCNEIIRGMYSLRTFILSRLEQEYPDRDDLKKILNDELFD